MVSLVRAAAVIAVVVVLVLSGCTADEPSPSPSPSETATADPVFATEEEALAAATEAYAEYQAALDDAFSSYETDGLAKVSIDPALATAVDSVVDYTNRGIRQSGRSSVERVALVDEFSGGKSPSLQIYACLDIGNVDVRDESGVTIVPVDRPDRYSLISTLDWSASQSRFLVRTDEAWDGQSVCE